MARFFGGTLLLSVKCSATLASVAAPPPGAQQGFGGPNYPRHPTGGSGWGATGPFGGGGGVVAATPLRHTRNCGKSCDEVVATLERNGGVWRLRHLELPAVQVPVRFLRRLGQKFRKGVGGRGLATNKPPTRAQKVLQKYVPLLLRGHRKKVTEKRPESLAFEGFPRANPLCPPTLFRNF